MTLEHRHPLHFHESLHQQAFGERMRVGIEAARLVQYFLEMQP